MKKTTAALSCAIALLTAHPSSANDFDVAELRHLRPVAMLYQSGYLTIKDYNPTTWLYTLGVPDEEVRRDLCTMMTGLALIR